MAATKSGVQAKEQDKEIAQRINALWAVMRKEGQQLAEQEPALGSFIFANVLNHNSFASALSFYLANKLSSAELPAMLIREVIEQHHNADTCKAAEMDILAVSNRDAACDNYLTPFLFFKGYHALQSYRVAHALWHQRRTALALHIQSRSSLCFNVDIHPAATIGQGILLDHASGIVIGETAVIEDDVSILQGVTLGGTGKQTGDRHPKIRRGVLIGAGAKILGNIEIGEGAKIGAGSVVLQTVPPHSTAAGVPARVIGGTSSSSPALTMDHTLESED